MNAVIAVFSLIGMAYVSYLFARLLSKWLLLLLDWVIEQIKLILSTARTGKPFQPFFDTPKHVKDSTSQGKDGISQE